MSGRIERPHPIAVRGPLGQAWLGADPVINKAEPLNQRAFPYVASVEKDRLPEEIPNPLKVRKTILIPDVTVGSASMRDQVVPN